MNWGKSIVLCFIIFAGFICTMVYKMATTNVDLVNKDYYKNEINYQSQINKRKNSSNLNINNAMTYSSENQTLRIGFPTNVNDGSVTFFRPSDKRLDFTVPVKKQPIFNYSTEKLEKGKWKIQATWTDGIREYYLEDEFVVR